MGDVFTSIVAHRVGFHDRPVWWLQTSSDRKSLGGNVKPNSPQNGPCELPRSHDAQRHNKKIASGCEEFELDYEIKILRWKRLQVSLVKEW